MNRRRNRAVKKRIIRGGQRCSSECYPAVPDALGSQFLLMAASVIDGAGSFQAAVDQELIGGLSPGMMEAIRRCLPKFLGGEVDGPDVRRDWAELVEVSRRHLAESRGGSDVV
jgi:hypothetical protein